MERGTEQDRILGQFFSLIEKDPECSAVMSFRGADRQTLHHVFRELTKAGDCEWSPSGFIPFVAMAEPGSLDHLLQRHMDSPSGIGSEEAFHLVSLFQRRA